MIKEMFQEMFSFFGAIFGAFLGYGAFVVFCTAVFGGLIYYFIF
jgi:hypothetical protein